MNVISKTSAQEVLRPHINEIAEIIQNSISEYYFGAEYAKVRHKHSLRTAASTCHDLIVDSLKEKFENVPGVSLIQRGQLFLLRIDGIVVIKFKKFKSNFLSSNVSTQQSLEYIMQQSFQPEFEGMPPIGLLHIGYGLNKLNSEINGIYATCRVGNVNEWIWDIREEIVIESPIELPIKTQDQKERKRIPTVKKDVGTIPFSRGEMM